MKRSRSVNKGRYTPSGNSNDEEAREGNIALIKIGELEKYIKDNYDVKIPESKVGPGLRISAKSGQFQNKITGELFDRAYSSYANLYYPDGDEYVMNELGIPKSYSPRRKSRKNTPHPKNVGRPTGVSHLVIKIPKTPVTPEPKACSICAVSRKSRKARKV
jgi:hypothetical protein